MPNRKFFLIACFLLSIFILLFSCTDEPVAPAVNGSISGQVLDSESSQPISGASISTNPATEAITTDDAGKYEITNLEVGKYTITASKSGYNKGVVSIQVEAGNTTLATIQLSKEIKSNQPPAAPTNPSPTDGTEDMSLSLYLSWEASDPDAGDTLSFDVYLYSAESLPVLLVSDTHTDSILATGLNYNTVYFWQVVARDNNGAETYGKTWWFKTVPIPMNPVVFASARNGNFDIYSAEVDTLDSKLVQLTHTPTKEWWPRISPQRNKIAFASDLSIEPQIYTMNLDGTDLIKITTVPIAGYNNYGIGYSWSPDGTQLIYSHYENLYRIDANGARLTRIATAPSGRHFRETDWSPLGNKIVALTIGSWFYDSEIYLIDADGSDTVRVVDNWPGAIEDPSFSPDGKKILFTYDISGYEVQSKRQLDTHIFILDILSGDTTDVSMQKENGTNDIHPRWSPDGSKIIFCNLPNYVSESGDIWIMDSSGENRKQIVTDGTMPDWR